MSLNGNRSGSQPRALVVLSLSTALCGGSLSTTRADAHDFWIEPSTFRPAVGTRVLVDLRVGERLVGEPVPRNPRKLVRLWAAGASGDAEIPGITGAAPAGVFVARDPGLHVVAYRGGRSFVELAAEKFEVYLREEGLESVSSVRASRQETGRPGRELFSRCAKALVSVGGEGNEGHDRVLGMPLELVPEKSPYGLEPGGPLPVRLLYEGRPIEGVRVVAMPKRDPKAACSGRTDREGRVAIPVGHGGLWLVKAVHMVPAPPGAGADWESLWASLTFEPGPL